MSLLPAMIAAAVAWGALAILVGNAARLPLDRPNARSLHAFAVPRVGGLAIWAGWLAGTVWLPGPKVWLAPLLALVAISLLDDHRGVHREAQPQAGCGWRRRQSTLSSRSW